MQQDTDKLGSDIPEADVSTREKWQISLIWLIPIITVVIGVFMMASAWHSKGPTIRITFDDAQGMVAGKTEVKYKSVVIGKVTKINLANDHSQVEVVVELDNNAADFATKDSRFWVVRPRVGLSGVSGLNTILSGPYINADTGEGEHAQTHFEGLDNPPSITHGEKGRNFELVTTDLGSLDIDTPVFYRHLQVGRVVGYELDDDGKHVNVRIFVKAPYDKFISDQTRFWNASGVDLSLGASGLKVNTESLASIMAGGIAFELPPYANTDGEAEKDKSFTLYADKSSAMKPEDGEPLAIKLHFPQSIRGLEKGAPVDFLGIELGDVKSVSLEYSVKDGSFPAEVVALIYPKRMGRAYRQFVKWKGKDDPGLLLQTMVKHGLRAQLRSGNLLTGKLYLALDFFPNSDKQTLDDLEQPLVLPTVAGSFDKLQEQIVDIVDQLHDMPLGDMVGHINKSLVHLESLLDQVDGTLAPQLDKTLEKLQGTLARLDKTMDSDSPMQSDLRRTLDEVRRSARSIRNLTDSLSRHPESLIRGHR